MRIFNICKHKKETEPQIIDNGTNNKISIGSGFDTSKIKITIIGNNNIVDIASTNNVNTGILNIFIKGNDSRIVVQRNLFVDAGGGYVCVGNASWDPVSEVFVGIGKNVGIGGCNMITYNSNSKIEIGNNVMMAWGITLYNTDSHPIYDLKTGKLKNHVSTLHIGNDCWIGANATILKNTFLADGIIVGFGAVVSGKHLDEHCAIAGNPAKKVAENLLWKRYDREYILNSKV